LFVLCLYFVYALFLQQKLNMMVSSYNRLSSHLSFNAQCI
jgi:hypothetical protein